MDELWEIVNGIVKDILSLHKEAILNIEKIDKVYKSGEEEILSWHIRERKKWAMGLLPKETDTEDIRNPIIAELRKKIGESE